MLNGPSPKRVYLLSCLTFGFYFLYWCAHSKADINRAAKQKLVPTTWLLILPGGNYWWMWKYAEALDFVSFRRLKRDNTFLLYMITSHTWLLLTLGVQPSLHFDNYGQTTHLGLIFICSYIALCIVLAILGGAFFCASMQRKITTIAITTPAPSTI